MKKRLVFLLMTSVMIISGCQNKEKKSEGNIAGNAKDA